MNGAIDNLDDIKIILEENGYTLLSNHIKNLS